MVMVIERGANKHLLSYRPYVLDGNTRMYHWRDGSRPPFPAENLEQEIRAELLRTVDELVRLVLTPNAAVERSAPSLRASASNRLLGEEDK